jgi:hypothetical protein
VANTKVHCRPVTYKGVTYPSITEFCRKYGLGYSAVCGRLKRGITDERLVNRCSRAR